MGKAISQNVSLPYTPTYNYSAAIKFVNPLQFSVFLYKFDQKCDQIREPN